MNHKKKWALAIGALLLLAAVASAASYADVFVDRSNLAWLLQHQANVVDFHRAHPVEATCAFFCLYVAIAALALPGASLLMLLAGASHGLIGGTLLCLTACTLGATLTMLGSRHLLRGPVERRYRSRLADIDAGLAREGAHYLFGLRLLPVIPFALVNLLFGVTAMKTRTFVWVSFVGMLASTAVYVNAGRELVRIDSLASVFSPGMVTALIAVGVLPLLTKKLIDRWRVRRTAGA